MSKYCERKKFLTGVEQRIYAMNTKKPYVKMTNTIERQDPQSFYQLAIIIYLDCVIY